MTKQDDKTQQKECLNMRSYSPSDAKLLVGGVKGLKDAQRLGVLHQIEENTRGTAATIKEEIDWKKELLESGKFNNKFSTNILENGAKNYMQEIYMG